MNWELLLNWMTHVQEGSWRAFRGAVAKIIDPDADADAASRRRRKLWTFLSDLGHVDFFLEGSQRWRVRAPALAGLLPPARSAVLTGGRTPRLLATLADGAAANGCRVRSDGAEDRPACIHVDGDPGGLLAAAGAAGIPFIESYASVLSGLTFMMRPPRSKKGRQTGPFAPSTSIRWRGWKGFASARRASFGRGTAPLATTCTCEGESCSASASARRCTRLPCSAGSRSRRMTPPCPSFQSPLLRRCPRSTRARRASAAGRPRRFGMDASVTGASRMTSQPSSS